MRPEPRKRRQDRVGRVVGLAVNWGQKSKVFEENRGGFNSLRKTEPAVRFVLEAEETTQSSASVEYRRRPNGHLSRQPCGLVCGVLSGVRYGVLGTRRKPD